MSTQDRALPAGELPKAGDQPAAARSTRVLYITGDARESRIVRGAFTHTHPHLDFDFAVELTGARAHLAQAWRYEAIVVGWSVPVEEAFSLIGHVREQGYPLAIVAAAEQSLDLYRQAGADECVRKGSSFVARLPVAIDAALRRRPAPAPVRSYAPGVTALRVAYAGDLRHLSTFDETGRGFSSAAGAVGQTGGGLRVEGVAGESLTSRVYLPHMRSADALDHSGVSKVLLTPTIEPATR